MTHPVRLGLALNFSVFLKEVADDPVEAFRIASKAFADCMDVFAEELCNESAQIKQHVGDNMTSWASDTHSGT